MSESVVLERLKDLRLSGFIEGLAEQRTSSRYQELLFEERLAMLVERETLRRSNARLQLRLKNAHIRFPGTLDDVNFVAQRGLSKTSFLELGTCRWVADRLSLIIIGKTGVGKSFLASVLADQACKLGFSVLYTRAADLIADLLLSKADGSFHSLRAKLHKTDLLIIDDWLRDPLEPAHAREFLDLLDDRYRRASCIFTSQLKVEDWLKNIADPTCGDAILDRIVHDTLRLNLDGESMRKPTSQLQDKGATSLRSGRSVKLSSGSRTNHS